MTRWTTCSPKLVSNDEVLRRLCTSSLPRKCGRRPRSSCTSADADSWIPIRKTSPHLSPITTCHKANTGIIRFFLLVADMPAMSQQSCPPACTPRSVTSALDEPQPHFEGPMTARFLHLPWRQRDGDFGALASPSAVYISTRMSVTFTIIAWRFVRNHGVPTQYRLSASLHSQATSDRQQAFHRATSTN
jgi:hypothetical protein